MSKSTHLGVVNRAELDDWLFEHAVKQQHPCYAEPRATEKVGEESYNAAWVDSVTNERIEIQYETN